MCPVGDGRQAEQDLWQFSLSGEIELWIEVGQPAERRLRKACGRARQAVVLNCGGRVVDIWWQQSAAALERLTNLRVLDLSADRVAVRTGLAERTIDIQWTLDGGDVWIGSGRVTVKLVPAARQG